MTRLQAGVFVALLAVALQAQQPAASPKSPGHTRSSGPEAGAISEGVYHNPSFEFSYKLPYGWVDRTREMQDDSAESSKSLLLLAVFERPPEATGDTLNSAVVIANIPGCSAEKLRGVVHLHRRQRRRDQRADREIKLCVAKVGALTLSS